MTKQSRRSKRKKAANSATDAFKAVFTCLGVVLGLMILVDACAFGIFDIKAPGYRPERFFQFDTRLGSFHKPNAKGYWYRYRDGSKFAVAINSFGFADSPRTMKKDKPRLALLGDSLIEFWEAETKDRGQYVMQRLLKDRWEVLNFGLRGFGTDQTRILFEEVGRLFQPDIAVLTFCVNDVWDNAATEGKPYYKLDDSTPDGLRLSGYPLEQRPSPRSPALKNFLWNSSFLLRRAGWVKHPLLKNHYTINEHSDLRPFKKAYDVEDERRWEVTLRLILAMHRFAQSQGIKFLLVEAPFRPVLDADKREQLQEVYGDVLDSDRVTRGLEKFCRDEGIAFLSLPRLAQARQMDADTLMDKDDDIHLNKDGIRFFSEAVIEALEEQGWLGPEVLAPGAAQKKR